MTEPHHCCLKWSNYLRQLTCALDNHRVKDQFVDVTLLCEGRKITAHKVVLSACSTYFRDVLSDSPHPHPLLIFNFIKYEDLNSIIKFMYQGEVNVKQEGLDSFLKLAKLLAVNGLNTEGSDTNEEHQIPPRMKLGQEARVQRSLSTSMDTSAKHPLPSCSQTSHKRRKLADTHNENVILAEEGDEEASRADDEYILGPTNDQPSTVDGLQEINQYVDYSGEIAANIKSEYDILAETDTEEKYDTEMTIESRRFTNPSTPHVHANLDLSASCSNCGAAGTEGASTDPMNADILAPLPSKNMPLKKSEDALPATKLASKEPKASSSKPNPRKPVASLSNKKPKKPVASSSNHDLKMKKLKKPTNSIPIKKSRKRKASSPEEDSKIRASLKISTKMAKKKTN